jgi:hypothetical protein
MFYYGMSDAEKKVKDDSPYRIYTDIIIKKPYQEKEVALNLLEAQRLAPKLEIQQLENELD